MVGLRDRARDKVQTYSLGMKQRLGIAAALLSDPTPAPPRRAVERPRSGRHRRDARDAQEPRRLGQDRLRLEPHPRRGPAARRRPRDRRRRPARPRGTDRAPARGRGRDPRPGRARRGRRRAAPSSTASSRARRPPSTPEAGWLSLRDRRRIGRPRSTGRSPMAGHLRLGSRDRQRSRVAVPRADRWRATPPTTRARSSDRRQRRQRHRPTGRGRRRREALRRGHPEARPPARDLCHVRAARRPARADLHRRRRDGAPGRRRRRTAARQALLLVTFPGAYTLLLSFILGLGGLFAMIYGAAIAGSEWTLGHPQGGRRPGREPEPLPAAVVRGDRGDGRDRPRDRVRDRDRRRDRRGGARRRGDDRPRRRGRRSARSPSCWPAAGWPSARRPPRLRDRDAGPQPARRDRRRDRGLLRRAVRDDLPARHRQVPAVQRGERRRRDVGQLRRRWRRWRRRSPVWTRTPR